jgi:hypothetical protein
MKARRGSLKKYRKSVRYKQSVEITSFPPRTDHACIVATKLIGRIIAHSWLWLNVDGGTKRPSGSKEKWNGIAPTCWSTNNFGNELEVRALQLIDSRVHASIDQYAV